MERSPNHHLTRSHFVSSVDSKFLPMLCALKNLRDNVPNHGCDPLPASGLVGAVMQYLPRAPRYTCIARAFWQFAAYIPLCSCGIHAVNEPEPLYMDRNIVASETVCFERCPLHGEEQMREEKERKRMREEEDWMRNHQEMMRRVNEERQRHEWERAQQDMLWERQRERAWGYAWWRMQREEWRRLQQVELHERLRRQEEIMEQQQQQQQQQQEQEEYVSWLAEANRRLEALRR